MALTAVSLLHSCIYFILTIGQTGCGAAWLAAVRPLGARGRPYGSPRPTIFEMMRCITSIY